MCSSSQTPGRKSISAFRWGYRKEKSLVAADVNRSISTDQGADIGEVDVGLQAPFDQAIAPTCAPEAAIHDVLLMLRPGRQRLQLGQGATRERKEYDRGADTQTLHLNTVAASLTRQEPACMVRDVKRLEFRCSGGGTLADIPVRIMV